MKTGKLVEMLEFYDTFSQDPHVFVDLGGRYRSVVGVVDNRNGVILKLSDRPSDAQYFGYQEVLGEGGKIRSISTEYTDIGSIAEMYPDTIYFEAFLVT